MRTRNITNKQYQYASLIMNEDITRGEAMRKAGYSEYMAEVPSRVEKSQGFALAMAKVAGETGKAYLKLVYELGERDLSEEKTGDIVKYIGILAQAWEKFLPKASKTTHDGDLSGAFENVIDISPVEPLQNKD